jgi:L-asparagine transporter-like permease
VVLGTIAASESKDPARNIAKATRSVIWRISVFYLLSIFVIISVVPWNDPLLPVQGSYQRALEIMHIPYAKLLVDMVVLVAVASCLNSSIYISSRMLYSLSKRGDAPGFIQRTSKVGVPRAAVIGSTLIGMLATIVNYFAPAEVFAFLLASSGSIALLVYLAIAFSQLRMRAILQRQHVEIAFKMWLYPWLTYVVIAFIVFALGTMFVMPQHRMEVSLTLALALLILVLGGLPATGTSGARHSRRPDRAGTTNVFCWV